MMKSKPYSRGKPLAVALAVTLAAGSMAPPVFAADKVPAEPTGTGEYQAWGDPAVAATAVNSGRALIDHLMTARASLNDGQIGQARSALIASQEFADAIERIMPYLTVVEEMMDTSDHVVATQVETLQADLLPVYASVDEIAVLAPEAVNQTQPMTGQAGKQAATDDSTHTGGELKEAGAVVAEHTIYLPVGYVGQQVSVAKNAINQPAPDISSAKAAVDRALNSLTLMVDSVVETTAG